MYDLWTDLGLITQDVGKLFDFDYTNEDIESLKKFAHRVLV
jgi:hypothetical protein